ncbi:2,4-dienoyl-CoA reductase-like NADH-dependent reductase (Old Yellow Enzyme family)/thioredoxin reductase [Sedimentibacter acidaminivorans]|uniref:2,4-dienoyl-CoA reductase-like NADH-dependent reductase (Old Yellow Enzyme family)/thioredoxin reductase n=1 Tax=Sedimentibacter acidaminivorans TaxID=913099 RepID=A0ABS4G9E0_9FIRM|nr:FAD-dependent oxidoreductase [Sedimentibacter acidaminivorans]MBP1924308.1 2,4-dienoyl-CoA reductase-like NADH-dependent reductase (Old Yellow Enzyme family)/thioredoxin reductase [Sedimentibacter acidaminivorans]
MNNIYSKVLEPIKIGNLTVRNRINMAPMTTLYAGSDGQVTDQLMQYYAARARGGTGMITIEGAYVNENGLQIPCSINVSNDKYIPGLSRIANAIKDNGSVAVLQLIHAGIQAWVEQSVGPSEIGRIDGKPISTELTPRALTTKEVLQYVQDFAQAARRAKMAGFDAVEVHGTHGYLIMQFLSPITNHRIDNYGIDRNLFAVEIVKEIKKTCGANFPVIFRLCADETLGDTYLKPGINIEDAKETAIRLEQAGVDAFNVTGGSDDVIHLYVPSAYVLEDIEGLFVHYAEQIKNVVSVPVMTGGGVETPEEAEKILQTGKVDMLFIGRELIAESDWIRKIETGRRDEIRPCVKCVECGQRIVYDAEMRCSVNPLSGKEWKYLNESEIPSAQKSKKVLVIGGGIAGMEAAKTCAIRGHNVTIVEKQDRLGGTVNIAAKPIFKYRFTRLVNYYKNEINRLGVEQKLNTTVDDAFITDFAPDAVIMATGSKETPIPFIGAEYCVQADDVLNGKVETGENVIVIGCGMVGEETAYHLARQGKKVTVFEALDPAMSVGGIALLRPTGLFEQYKIKVNTHTPIVEIYEDSVLTVDNMGRKIITKADSIVSAIGRVPLYGPEFISELRSKGLWVIPIGDAVAARKVSDAVHEAFQAAMSI